MSVVNVNNEWDPLEEVIVGTLEGATVPEWDIQLRSTMPKKWWDFYKKHGGEPFDPELIKKGEVELGEFIKILEGEGVKVKRPDGLNYSRPYSTMNWSVKGGLYAAMPRDFLLVIGDEIIESPMSWRSRYYENDAYRKLIKHYFDRGAKWESAPKPELKNELYNTDYELNEGENNNYSITEFEPVFDAADFIKCGKHIFAQKSNVTNEFGINWLQRHIGDRYSIITLEVNDDHPMHIDATFMPLAPGKLLINENRLTKIPDMFKDWEILVAPTPNIPDDHPLFMTSKWINMNILMLDEKRVIVEKGEENMIKSFKDWGFQPITCNFRHFNTFGGSFHCATAEIRRKGELKNYFD